MGVYIIVEKKKNVSKILGKLKKWKKKKFVKYYIFGYVIRDVFC